MNGPGVKGNPDGTYGREPRAPFGPCPSCHIYHDLSQRCPRDAGLPGTRQPASEQGRRIHEQESD